MANSFLICPSPDDDSYNGKGHTSVIRVNLRWKPILASISPSSPNPFSLQGRRGTGIIN